jgi:phosphatidate phosphatase PAH1
MVYLMSAEEQIAQRIISSGSLGVKKTDLRKEFAEAEIDTILENMVTHGNVFIDKKGAAYHCWYKDHYFQNLLNSDPKFRLTYEAIKSLEQSFNRTSDGLAKTIESLANSIPNLSKLTIAENEPVVSEKIENDQLISLQFEQFKNEFDIAIANYSNSIGWVELSKIRNELCGMYNMSNEEFYRLVEQLTNKYQDKYELSTGGYEGLTVRGLLHGFVRCI